MIHFYFQHILRSWLYWMTQQSNIHILSLGHGLLWSLHWCHTSSIFFSLPEQLRWFNPKNSFLILKSHLQSGSGILEHIDIYQIKFFQFSRYILFYFQKSSIDGSSWFRAWVEVDSSAWRWLRSLVVSRGRRCSCCRFWLWQRLLRCWPSAAVEGMWLSLSTFLHQFTLVSERWEVNSCLIWNKSVTSLSQKHLTKDKNTEDNLNSIVIRTMLLLGWCSKHPCLSLLSATIYLLKQSEPLLKFHKNIQVT